MSDHLSLKLRRALNGTWIALLLTWLGLVLDITFWCWPMERNWWAPLPSHILTFDGN